MSSKQTSIAIVGAGPAGLTLARLLLISPLLSTPSTTPRLRLTIYEKDADRHSRFHQGGTLDLHPETGLAALRAADLWDEFIKWARYEGEELVVADKNGMRLVHMTEASDANLDARPEIDRERLKDLLLDSVCEKGGEDIVRWGKQLKTIDEETGVLQFADGTSEGPFDLVVGCDGAWSRVRPVLTSVKPDYAGVTGFELHIDEPAAKHPEISKYVGRGIFFVFSDCKSIIAQRMGDDSIKTSCYLMREEGYAAKLMAEHEGDEQALKEVILAHFPDWIEEFKQWVKVARVVRPWNLYELPVGHRWEHRKGYTLISDAAHLMTPFAGEGVNAGMRDSLELCKTIVDALTAGSVLDESMKQFEAELFVRGKKVQEETMRNKVNMFNRGAPVSFLLAMTDELAKMYAKDPSRGLWWVLLQPVKAAAWCYFSSLVSWGRWRRWWYGT